MRFVDERFILCSCENFIIFIQMMLIMSSTSVKPIFSLWLTENSSSVFQVEVISIRKALEKLTGSFLKKTS